MFDSLAVYLEAPVCSSNKVWMLLEMSDAVDQQGYIGSVLTGQVSRENGRVYRLFVVRGDQSSSTSDM